MTITYIDPPGSTLPNAQEVIDFTSTLPILAVSVRWDQGVPEAEERAWRDGAFIWPYLLSTVTTTIIADAAAYYFHIIRSTEGTAGWKENFTVFADDGTGPVQSGLGDEVQVVHAGLGDGGDSFLGSRMPHRHQVLTGVPVSIVPGQANAEGDGDALARAAHQHHLDLTGVADALSLTLAGDVTGPHKKNRVSFLQDVPLNVGAPARGDVMTFDGTNIIFAPTPADSDHPYINVLSRGVVPGALADDAQRATNTANWNATVIECVTVGKWMAVPAGTYEIFGAIVIALDGFVWRGTRESVIVQHDRTKPVLHVGPPRGTPGVVDAITLRGFCLKYNGTALAVSGGALELTGVWMSTFEEYVAGDDTSAAAAVSVPWRTVYEDPDGTPCFSNSFRDALHKHWSFRSYDGPRPGGDAGYTGCVFENVVFSLGDATSKRDISGVAGACYLYTKLHMQTQFIGCTFEWGTVSAVAVFDVSNNLALRGTAVTGITLKRSSAGPACFFEARNSRVQTTSILPTSCTLDDSVTYAAVFGMSQGGSFEVADIRIAEMANAGDDGTGTGVGGVGGTGGTGPTGPTGPDEPEEPPPGGMARPGTSLGVGFYVVGRELYDANGNAFRMRGNNKTHQDNWSPGLGVSGSNATRWILYFSDDPARCVNDMSSNSIGGSTRNGKAVQIGGYWDGTCESDSLSFTTMVNRWVRDASIYQNTVVDGHPFERYFILNIANEWGDNAIAWRDAYIAAIPQIRAAGFHGCIMVDAPGCGQNPAPVITYGQAILNADPEKNVMFSVHVYGNFYDSAGGVAQSFSDQSDLGPTLVALKNTGLCVVVGEFGPGRDIGASPTMITPARVITLCETNGIGWLAWSWDDNNLDGGMANDGSFAMSYSGAYTSSADLTIFGKVVVEDPVVGWKAIAQKASIFP